MNRQRASKRIHLWIAVAVVVALGLGGSRVVADEETYMTGVLALSQGHSEMAVQCFDFVLERSPGSLYAPAACVTRAAICMGRVHAYRVLLEVLNHGAQKTVPELEDDFASGIRLVEELKAEYVDMLVASYGTYARDYRDAIVTLRIAFLDVSENLDAVREGLERLEGGSWIPLLLLTGLFNQVELFHTYSDLLAITGVDFQERSLEEWLQGGEVERLLVKEFFLFQLGELFAKEGYEDLAVDALQEVVVLTEYQPFSHTRADAISLLETLGETPRSASEQPSGQGPSPYPALPAEFVGPVILFDETRLVVRPTGETNCRISDLAWFGCSDLAAMLRRNGFGVSSIEKTPLILDELGNDDVLAIITTDHNHPYSTSDLSAILTFVEEGGGLLICESTWGGPQQRDFTVGALAYFFGVGFIGNGMISESDSTDVQGTTRVEDILSHPATEGVSELLLVEAAYLNPTGPSTPIIYSDEGSWFDDSTLEAGVRDEGEPSGPFPVLAVLEIGEGRVAFLADGMLFTNGWLNESDNRPFALSLFHWLAGQ